MIRGCEPREGPREDFMGEFSIFHWLVVLAIVLILFGGRRIPEVMRGLGEGIRNFKEGMAGTAQPQQPPAAPPATPAQTEEKK